MTHDDKQAELKRQLIRAKNRFQAWRTLRERGWISREGDPTEPEPAEKSLDWWLSLPPLPKDLEGHLRLLRAVTPDPKRPYRRPPADQLSSGHSTKDWLRAIEATRLNFGEWWPEFDQWRRDHPAQLDPFTPTTAEGWLNQLRQWADGVAEREAWLEQAQAEAEALKSSSRESAEEAWWLKLDGWTLEQAANILAGNRPDQCTDISKFDFPGEPREFQRRKAMPDQQQFDHWLALLRPAVAAGRFTRIPTQPVSFPPGEIVRWAADKGLSIPPALMGLLDEQPAKAHEKEPSSASLLSRRIDAVKEHMRSQGVPDKDWQSLSEWDFTVQSLYEEVQHLPIFQTKGNPITFETFNRKFWEEQKIFRIS